VKVLVNLLFAVLVALIIGAMFSAGLRGRNRWAGTIWLYVILLFGSWALGAWLRPVGPPAWEVHWVPFVIAAAFIALILAAATPRERRFVRSEDGRLVPVDPNAIDPDVGTPDSEAPGSETPESVTIGVFFWLALAVSLLAIVLSYFMPPP
jgi:hypothetical protein